MKTIKGFITILTLTLALGLTAFSQTVLTSIDGSRVDLDAQKGKVVVLAVGASWLPLSAKQIEVTNALAKKYQGRDIVARFFAGILRPGRSFELVPTRANGQPAFGAYMRAPAGVRHGTGLFVLTLTGDRICALTRFETNVFPWFGLPHSLPSR